MSSLFFKVCLICASSAPWLETGGREGERGGTWSGSVILEHVRLSCLALKSSHGSDFPWWKAMWWENGQRASLNPHAALREWDVILLSLQAAGQNPCQGWYAETTSLPGFHGKVHGYEKTYAVTGVSVSIKTRRYLSQRVRDLVWTHSEWEQTSVVILTFKITNYSIISSQSKRPSPQSSLPPFNSVFLTLGFGLYLGSPEIHMEWPEISNNW